MSGLFGLGIIFCVLVLGISVAVGVWGRRLTRNLADYYVAGRSVDALSNGLAMVSLSLSLTTFLGLTALIWFGFYLAIALYAAFTASFVIMLVVAAPYLRRHKTFTSMDFIGERFYSPRLRIAAVFIMLVVSTLYLIGNVKGIGIVFELLLGIPAIWGVLIGGLVVTFYVTLGGMYGVTYNQTFQSIVLTVAFMVPLMMILKALGFSAWWFPPLGYGAAVPAMIQMTPHYFFPFVVHPAWYIAVFLGSAFGIIGLPHFVMRYFTVRDAKDARWSTVVCVFLVGLINTSAYAMGFAGVYYVARTGVAIAPVDADKLVFILTQALTNNWWLALTVAGALAASLSTVAGLLMIMGTGLVHDLYAVVRPGLSDDRKLTLSIWTMAAVGVACTLLSIRPPQFILVTIMWAFGIAGASLGVPITLGIWWKRATREGAAAAMIVGFLTSFIPYVMIEIQKLSPMVISRFFYGPLGWVKVIAWSVPLSFMAMIVVSWLTKPPPLEARQQVDAMHGWPDYREERYQGKGLPITVIVLCALIMLSVTTLYGVFPK
ncbi:MAG: cation acetate symporter [bacterium]|nr:cation acetate symporter [bacterium]